MNILDNKNNIGSNNTGIDQLFDDVDKKFIDEDISSLPMQINIPTVEELKRSPYEE